MAIVTRKEKMDHMFALIEESRVLVGRVQEHEDIPATIRQLNYRVEELKKELTLNKYELEKDKERSIEETMLNMNRGDPLKEGTD